MGQIIISIGRQYASGGHEIAAKIAEKLNVNLYDKNLLEQISKEKGFDSDFIKNYEEKPKKLFLTRNVNGYSSSIADNLAQIEFDYIKEKADAGESFVIVGRCSDYILRDNPHFLSIFISGDDDARIERLMKVHSKSKSELAKEIEKQDKARKKYHDTHSKYGWGESKAYDVCINSSLLGIDGTVEALLNIISAFQKKHD